MRNRHCVKDMNKKDGEVSQAGVAKLGNGAGLRILFLVIQGFKSLPLHSQSLYPNI